MTDNDIIKALECCTDYSYESLLCRECPYFEYGFNRRCRDELSEDSLALITRQKAKIEALEMDNAQLQSDNINANMNREHLQAEIERLKGWDRWIVSESHAPIIKKARAEAIKEFAERLKAESHYMDVSFLEGMEKWEDVVFASAIDNLVKEMEGEHEVS